RHYWMTVVTLDLASNPHANHDKPCVRVLIGDRAAGFFTDSMSERHRPTLEAAWAVGLRPTAVANIYAAEKRGASIWRLKVGLRMPETTSFTLVPKRLLNVRTGTNQIGR